MKYKISNNGKETFCETPKDVFLVVLKIIGCPDPEKATGAQHAVAFSAASWCDVLCKPGEHLDVKAHGFSIDAID